MCTSGSILESDHTVVNILVVASGLVTPVASPATGGRTRASGRTSATMQTATRRSPAGQPLTSTCAPMTLLGNLIPNRTSLLLSSPCDRTNAIWSAVLRQRRNVGRITQKNSTNWNRPQIRQLTCQTRKSLVTFLVTIRTQLQIRFKGWVLVARKRRKRKTSSSTTPPTMISPQSLLYVILPPARTTQAKRRRLYLNNSLLVLNRPQYRWRMIFLPFPSGHARSPRPRNGKGDSAPRFPQTSNTLARGVHIYPFVSRLHHPYPITCIGLVAPSSSFASAFPQSISNHPIFCCDSGLSLT